MYPKYKSPVKYFKDYKSLSLSELKRVKKSHEALLLQIQEREFEINNVKKSNDYNKVKYEQDRKIYSDWYKLHVQPLLDKQRACKASIEKLRVGVVSLSVIYGTAVEFNGKRYKFEALELIEKLKEIQSSVSKILSSNPAPISPTLAYPPKSLKRVKLFKFKGVNCNIDFSNKDADFWDDFIAIKISEIEEEKKEMLLLKAKAAGNQAETRKAATTYRRKNSLSFQLAKFQDCPYCETPLDEKNSVLEHIYPVAHGGKSSESNLVWICSQCNSRKSDLTLSRYCKKYELDRDKIETNLDWLGKTY